MTTLFQGFDTFQNKTTFASAVSGPSGPTGSTTSCQYTVCQSTEDLYNAMNISGSLSASYGALSGNAKTTFISELAKSSTTVYICVYAFYAGTQTASGGTLAQQPPVPFDAAAFYHLFGDQFVSSVTSGIEYYAVYSYNCQTQEEKTQLLASFDAHGISTSGDVTVSLTTDIQSVAAKTVTQSSFTQQANGYSGTLPAPADMVQFANNIFNAYNASSAAVLSYGLSGYEEVSQFPYGDPGWNVIEDNRTVFTTADAMYAEIASTVSHAHDIQTIYNQYGYTADTQSKSNTKLLKQDLDALNKLFAAFHATPVTAQVVPLLNYTSIGAPTIQMYTSVTSLGGGAGGAAWADWSQPDGGTCMTLQNVTFWGGPLLNGVVTHYASPSGQTAGGSYGQIGEGGDNSNTLTLSPNECINKISTTASNDINSIAVTTTKGQTLSAPNVPDPASPNNGQEWNASSTSFFFGFEGAAGDHIDSIGVVTLNFSPAQWAPAAASLSMRVADVVPADIGSLLVQRPVAVVAQHVQ